MRQLLIFILIFFIANTSIFAQETPEEYLKEAESLLGQKKTEEAMAKLDEMLVKYPNDGKGRLTRAVLGVLLNKDMKKVGEDLLIASEYTGKKDSIFTSLGLDLVQDGEFENAKIIAVTGLKKYPKSYPLHTIKGESELGLGNHKQAKKALKKALKIKPDFLYALNIQAKNQFALKKQEDAFVIINKVLAEKPKLISALQIRSDFYKESGENEKALDDLNQIILASDKPSQKAYFMGKKAFLYQEIGKTEQACKWAKMASDAGDRRAMEKIGAEKCVDTENTFWVREENLLVYEIIADDLRYNFELQVLNYSTEKIRFLWAMNPNRKQKSGTVTMTKSALQTATNQLNYFTDKAQPTLEDKTSVWISQKVFHDFKENGSAIIDTGSGEKKFTVRGDKLFKTYNGLTEKEFTVKVFEVRSENEKEALWILDNPENPLIVEMDLGWKIYLLSVY